MIHAKKLAWLVLFLVPAHGFSQTVVNVYARVTAISGKTVTITAATGSFPTGDAFIMQMQDSVIGTNTGNNSSFGNIANIQSAGLAEVVSVSSISGSTITLSKTPTNIYHFTNNSRVQIVSYPTLGGGGNYTISSPIVGTAWNGNTGGVVAFKVNGTLTINSDISVDGQGFRGGAAGNNAPGDYACDASTYFDNAGGVNTSYYGYKGEGIYNSNGVYNVAKGKLANGGGGGNLNNAGGGGGGNLSAGGDGGYGWTCSAASSGGGQGGVDLSAYVSPNRFFMGGGGGGGQQNNNVGTPGGNGGGIIMIKANVIQTNSGCNGGTNKVSLSSQGIAGMNAGNDGAGGGGAGGTILLQVNNYQVSNACPLTINTSGGKGGTVNNSGNHGGGAGGGKGISIIGGSINTPANINVVDTAGSGGASSTSTGAPVAGSGSTSTVSGTLSTIFTSASLLPVTLQSFDAAALKNSAVLHWQSATEQNFDAYIVERAVNNASNFSQVARIPGKGSNAVYSYTDDLRNYPGATIYYRLKMVDIDGKFEYSAVKAINMADAGNNASMKAFPNPAVNTVYISGSTISGNNVSGTIRDMQGRAVRTFSKASLVAANTIAVPVDGLIRGQYIVSLNGTNGQEYVVVMKQ